MLGSCTTAIDQGISGYSREDGSRIRRFHATTEENAPSTKVYADENMKVLWNADDRISIFNFSTYNFQYAFTGDDGDTAGDFEDVTPSGFHTGTEVDYITAVYPYSKSNKMNNEGGLTMELPSEQSYKAHSFGIGANAMIAVTEGDFLAFKNVGGYISLRLYGDQVAVSRITIKGNNGEKIAGKASISMPLNGVPAVTMDATATDEISVVCDPVVILGATEEEYTDFWFVIPPVTFEQGFTITVTDAQGGEFTKSTTRRFPVSRNTLEWMNPLKVELTYADDNVVFEDDNFKAYCVENFDTDRDGEISLTEASRIHRIEVSTDAISSLKGIEKMGRLQELIARGTESQGRLSEIDLSGNPLLRVCMLDDNQFITIDLSGLPMLEEFGIGGNPLQEIDFSHNPRLGSIGMNNVPIDHLPDMTFLPLWSLHFDHVARLVTDPGYFRHFPNLGGLNMSFYEGTTIDLSQNKQLNSLWAYYCPNLEEIDLTATSSLAFLDLGECPSLRRVIVRAGADFEVSAKEDHTEIVEIIYFEDANFQAYCLANFDSDRDGRISVSEAEAVERIDITADNIVSLKGLEYFKNLRFLKCVGTEIDKDHEAYGTGMLSYLDVTHCSELEELIVYQNRLETLDVTHCSKLWNLHPARNLIKELDLSNNPLLSHLGADFNLLTEIDLSRCPLLGRVDLSANQLSVVDVSALTNLRELLVNRNHLSSLNVRALTSLAELRCDENQLTALDVSNNTALKYLSAGSNQISNLDLLHNPNLITLNIDGNRVSSINVANLAELEELVVSGNQLTTIDISHNPKLNSISLQGNSITELPDFTGLDLVHLHLAGMVQNIPSDFFTQFPNLESVNFGGYAGTTLDLSQNTKLQAVWAGDLSNMVVLNLSAAPNLKYLYCRTWDDSLQYVYVKAGVSFDELVKNDNTEIIYVN